MIDTLYAVTMAHSVKINQMGVSGHAVRNQPKCVILEANNTFSANELKAGIAVAQHHTGLTICLHDKESKERSITYNPKTNKLRMNFKDKKTSVAKADNINHIFKYLECK